MFVHEQILTRLCHLFYYNTASGLQAGARNGEQGFLLSGDRPKLPHNPALPPQPKPEQEALAVPLSKENGMLLDDDTGV